MPSVDLIIRTGNRFSLSGFLLWYSDYSEVIFSEKLWPDFKFAHLKKSLFNYLRRTRNYGK